jgi:hypothetical protein
MTAPPADADLLPPRRVRRALGDMPGPSLATMRHRGQLDGLLGPSDERGHTRFTMQGFLALACYRAFTELRIEPPRELPPSAFLQYASLWLRTRGTARPVREAVFRWYGRPGAEDSRFSRAINEDALPPDQQPVPGARITIRLDLDVICGEAERALLEEPQPGRTPEEILGLPTDDE